MVLFWMVSVNYVYNTDVEKVKEILLDTQIHILT